MQLRANYFLSILSIALVLYLIGLYVILSLQSSVFINYIKEGIELIVEYDNDASDKEILDVSTYLEESSFVREGSIDFMSKKEAYTDMQSLFDENIGIGDEGLPVSAMSLFKINHEYYNDHELEKIEEEIIGYSGVNSFFYQSDLFELIQGNIKKATYGLTIAGVILFIISITLISSTLKLNLYTKRKLIKTMDLIGAKRAFIRRPFIIKSFFHGLFSGLCSAGLIYLSLFILSKYFSPVTEMLYSSATLYVYGGIILLGILMNVLFTRILINSYLKVRIEDMH